MTNATNDQPTVPPIESIDGRGVYEVFMKAAREHLVLKACTGKDLLEGLANFVSCVIAAHLANSQLAAPEKLRLAKSLFKELGEIANDAFVKNTTATPTNVI